MYSTVFLGGVFVDRLCNTSLQTAIRGAYHSSWRVPTPQASPLGSQILKTRAAGRNFVFHSSQKGLFVPSYDYPSRDDNSNSSILSKFRFCLTGWLPLWMVIISKREPWMKLTLLLFFLCTIVENHSPRKVSRRGTRSGNRFIDDYSDDATT